MPENTTKNDFKQEPLNLDKRNVFRNLMISMISFGILVGLVFPLFARFALDSSKALTIQFIVMCVFAGFWVGFVNYLLFRRIVSNEMNGIVKDMNDAIHRTRALEATVLTNQTQKALAETDALLSITAKLNAAQEFQDVLSAITEQTILKNADQSLMMCLFDRPLKTGQVPEWIFPVAYKVDLPVEIADCYPLSAFEVNPNTIFTSQIVIIKDMATDQRLDRITRKLFQDVFQTSPAI
jgi:hypothetical protein